MAKQLGFFINAGRCVQCQACEVACKATNSIELGPKWRRVATHWEGRFPDVTNIAASKACMHCAKPSCIDACPVEAISKRAEDGIVVVDQEKCISCKSCGSACPYGAPQYGKSGKMQKCILCYSRIEKGKQPACVSTCPGEALGFGPIDELVKLEGAIQPGGANRPSFVIVPAYRGVKAEHYAEVFFPR
jgi:anaerobic dimethyl sulfoxide reductase subunit B (iron-sulfur subunit)